MLNGPFSPWPSYSQEEIDAVLDVLATNKVNYWTGEQCRFFEKEYAEWVGCEHAIAVANGTVALDVALHGLGIGPGDEVIVTPRTFIASISSVVCVGARPVFADVDRESGNLTAKSIATKLSEKTKAVIVVHLAGWPCDMDPIMELAKHHDFFVVEDCAQAHGAKYEGKSVGSIGHVAAWSFCQDKIMTTGGEGGMITTNDDDLWSKMWSFKDHGKSWDAVYNQQHPPGFRWLHDSIGMNGRMLEMQAAIGRIQLHHMAEWTAKRNKNARVITQFIEKFGHNTGPIRLPNFSEHQTPDSRHAQYKYYIYVRPENLKPDWSRDRIVSEISALGVPCLQGSCSEAYNEKAFDNTDWRPEKPLPIARELGETSLCFLVHPTLTEHEIEKTGKVICQILERATACS